MQSTFNATEIPPAAADRVRPGLWIASLGLGALAAGVLYAAQPGINWLLIILGVAASLLTLERPAAPALRSPRYVAAGIAILLAGAAAVTDDPLVEFLLLVGILWLGALVAWLATGRLTDSFGAARLAGILLRAPPLILRESARAVGEGVRAVSSVRAVVAVRGIAIAVLVVAPLFALLGEADQTLGALRASIITLVTSLEGLGRLVFLLCVAFGCLGYLNLAHRYARTSCPDPEPNGRVARYTDTERLIVLGSVAILFGVFLGLQVSYLFGNPGARAGSGVTLAEVVHRGFVEMTVVVALAAAVIVVLDRNARRGGREVLVRAVSGVVLLECLVILVSAYHRLSAYESAYGYTEFRIYVRLYVCFLGVSLVLLGAEFARGIDVGRLLWRNCVAALATLVVLGYWNHSAWIVRANLERYSRTGQLDVDYLGRTDNDGIPELVRALPGLDSRTRAEVRATLCAAPRKAACSGVPGATAAPWFEWNLRRAAAANAIKEFSREDP